jgi:hypothetical protein
MKQPQMQSEEQVMRLKWALALFTCLIATSTSRAQDANVLPLPSGDFPYPESGVKIGQGWDSFNQRATTASCVEASETRIEQASFDTHVEQLRSSYSLVTKTTTSISAAYGGFGFKASGKVSDAASTNLNTDDQKVLFTFESSNGSTFAASPNQPSQDIELSDQAVKALAALKSDTAQQTYFSGIWSQPNAAHSGAIRMADGFTLVDS